jgi:hypothetical protein
MTRNRTRLATTLPTPTTANILRVFRAASADHVRQGREWYRRAHQAARELAAMGDGDVVRAAAVIAVLSPSTPWHRNVALARKAYAMAADGATFDDIVTRESQGGHGLGTKGDSARKAAALVLGGDPHAIVSGPKVVPFWLRIADAASGDTTYRSVVVDRHAYDIAVGIVTDDRTRGLALGRVGGTREVQLRYAHAAAVLRRTGEAPDITPAELQAVTWVAWRALFAHSQGKAEARRDAAALAA